MKISCNIVSSLKLASATVLLLDGRSMSTVVSASTDPNLLPEYGCTGHLVIPYLPFTQDGPTVDGSHFPGNEIDPTAPNYGVVNFFIRNVLEATAAIDPTNCVLFEAMDDVESDQRCIGTAVGAGPSACGGNAASLRTLADTDTQATIGPLITYGAAFGLTFEQQTGWVLGEGGALEAAQQLIDERGENTVVVPMMAGPPQSSGVLRYDLAEVGRETNGGMAAICSLPEAWRILGTNSLVIERACFEVLTGYSVDTCAEDGNLCLVPGASGEAPIDNVRSGSLTGFEYTSALDNYEVFFNNDDNAGMRGLAYYHYPSWHQPFFLGGMYINADVWANLEDTVQKAIYAAGEASVFQAFDASSSVECDNLGKILKANDPGTPAKSPDEKQEEGAYLQCDGMGMFTGSYTDNVNEACSAEVQLACWPDNVMDLMQRHGDEHLLGNTTDPRESFCGGNADCIRLRDSLLEYMYFIDFEWNPPNPVDHCNGLKLPENCSGEDGDATSSATSAHSLVMIGAGTLAASVGMTTTMLL